jgi:predicted GNAT family N-acyltransferase
MEISPVFKVVTTPDELLKVFCVRSIVFVEEQQCPYKIEHDEYDYSAFHILGEDDGEPFAAGRVRFMGEYAKLERIAVRRGWRDRGLGHELVDFMIGVAKEQGFKSFKMHAQAHLCEFYRRHGFEVHGGMFQEANIDHYAMYRHD